MSASSSCPPVPIIRNHKASSRNHKASSSNVELLNVANTRNVERQLHCLQIVFVLLCALDTVHWAYLFRDDSTQNLNSWKFYVSLHFYDGYYLLLRIFIDIFTCLLGLGAAMWTRKPVLTLACLIVQPTMLTSRGIWPPSDRLEDMVFVSCEMIAPLIWTLFGLLLVRTLNVLNQTNIYSQPPVIVLTVKNDENDESVQIEINP